MKERGLFDEEERLNILSKLGDNLETLNQQPRRKRRGIKLSARIKK